MKLWRSKETPLLYTNAPAGREAVDSAEAEAKRLEAIAKAAKTAAQTWQMVRTNADDPKLFPGHTTTYDEQTGRVEITRQIRPRESTTTGIFFDDKGDWAVEKVTSELDPYAPGMGGTKPIIRTTTTMPLSGEGSVATVRALYDQSDDGSLTLADGENSFIMADNGAPVSQRAAENITASLQELRATVVLQRSAAVPRPE